jgi:hypothetical protein
MAGSVPAMRCFLLSLLVLFAVPAAANAATLRIEQQGPDGATITGGCYRAESADDFKQRCDLDDGATDGVVVLDELLPGEFSVEETRAPSGYAKSAGFTVSLGDGTVTRSLRHQPTPRLRIVTTGLTGSCWLVREPGQTEGYDDRCDADDGADDGTTTFLDLAPGEYELVHLSAPDGIDRIDDSTFSMRAEDTTLTFALEPAVAPQNTVAPAVSGGHDVGDELTGDTGTWTGSAKISFSDQWERCNADGTGCVSVGDFDSHYTIRAGDAGKALRYSVSASNDGGRRTASSAPHLVNSLGAPDDAPYNLERPSTSGTPKPGELLTAYPGHWSTHYGNLQFDYRWLRCAGEDCDVVGYGDTYAITYADEGSSLLVEVTATDAGGVGRARSNPRVVMTMRPINTSPPTFVGRQRLGEKLTGQFGTWTSPDGSRISSSFSWQRCEADGTQCATIPGQPTSGLGAGRHVITMDDIGHRLRVEVGARNDSGVRYAYSGLTEVLTLHPPVAVTEPGYNGRARLGMTLQGYSPRWSYDGVGAVHVTFGWQRCEADGSRCVTIAGSDSRHTVDEDDVGHRLRLQVSGESSEGDTYAYSPLTEVIERHPPVSAAPPTFMGVARLGFTVSGRNGSWAYDGAGPIRISFTWQRCEADGSQCVTIAGSDNRHVVEDVDAGHRLRLQVAASTIEGTAYAYSALTDVIERHPPVATTAAGFNGRARLGLTLQGYSPRWSYDGMGPVHVEFSWQRCAADGSQCATIAGSDSRHTVNEDDLGHRLRLQVSASSVDGTTYVYSELTELIERHPPIATNPPAFSGTPRFGFTLQGRNGDWAYDGAGPMHITFSWQRCEADGTQCVTIPAGTNASRHTIVLADLGHRLRLQVGAETPDGTTYAYTALTPVIA